MEKVGKMPKKLYQKSLLRAKLGDAEAMFRMFVLFLLEEKDLSKAEYWLKKLVDAGDLQATTIWKLYQDTHDLEYAYNSCKVS